MKSAFFLVIVLASATPAAAARASTPECDLRSAIEREHADSQRVAYHAQLAIIAARDLATAEIERRTARDRWNTAIENDKPRDAGRWAQRHLAAMQDVRAARARLSYHAYARDIAREDFQAAAHDVRRATVQANRARG